MLKTSCGFSCYPIRTLATSYLHCPVSQNWTMLGRVILMHTKEGSPIKPANGQLCGRQSTLWSNHVHKNCRGVLRHFQASIRSFYCLCNHPEGFSLHKAIKSKQSKCPFPLIYRQATAARMSRHKSNYLKWLLTYRASCAAREFKLSRTGCVPNRYEDRSSCAPCIMLLHQAPCKAQKSPKTVSHLQLPAYDIHDIINLSFRQGPAFSMSCLIKNSKLHPVLGNNHTCSSSGKHA